MIASAFVLVAGCASGGTGEADAHVPPPRPDAAPMSADAAVGDDAGSVRVPDASSADGGVVADAGVAGDASARTDAGWRCCSSDADCSAAEVCVVTEPGSPGACRRPPSDRDCWTDADCEPGETCGGARISECGDFRVLLDSPGRCR